MSQPFHFFDPYLKDREQAAIERALWHKAHRLKGPRQPDQFRKGGLGKRMPRPVTLAKVK